MLAGAFRRLGNPGQHLRRITTTSEALGLDALGIGGGKTVHYNLSFDELAERENAAGLKRSDSGAVLVDTGKFTGRSPKDKYITMEPATQEDVDWGAVNQSITPEVFSVLEDKVKAFYNSVDEFYVLDGYCGASKASRRSIRFLGFKPEQHHFVKTMFLRPDESVLTPNGIAGFQPDFTVINACEIKNDQFEEHGLNSEVFVCLSVEKKLQIIGGTSYCGEMKKGIFSMMNYWLPLEGKLPMHCSANKCPKTDSTALFFGLSGTGKTTLSADPNRLLIGDDEHGWDSDGIFNFEGGCYAKTIDLERDKEPEIWDAIKTDALLENVAPVPGRMNEHGIDFGDTTKTPNGRVAYPLFHIPNHEPSGRGGHPDSCIFLTCDAFGVLPPVSRLSTGQAMYHFISGFTAKVAGTERGVTEPTPTFSACFGAAFLPLHPTVYANLLEEKLLEHGTTAYLVNTGWAGGPATNPDDGSERARMDIPITRACITAILEGSIKDANWTTSEYFGVEIPSHIAGVDSDVLNPAVAWEDKAAFHESSLKLAEMFRANFSQYQDDSSLDLAQFGPIYQATDRNACPEEDEGKRTPRKEERGGQNTNGQIGEGYPQLAVL